MVLSEDEPLEDTPRHFDPGGCMSAMTTPPRVVKLGTSQVRQPLRMNIQAPKLEVVTKVSAKEKKNAEPITEDKKAEQKNHEKKSPVRWKVKMRKRKQREKVADLSDQLRKAPNIAEERNKNLMIRGSMGTWSTSKRREVEGDNKPSSRSNSWRQEKACSRNGIHGLPLFHIRGSRLNEMFERAGRYRFSL